MGKRESARAEFQSSLEQSVPYELKLLMDVIESAGVAGSKQAGAGTTRVFGRQYRITLSTWKMLMGLLIWNCSNDPGIFYRAKL